MHLLLLGAGHAHLLLLHQQIHSRMLQGYSRITLLTAQPKALYSGMIGGVLAGEYALTDAQIDVVALARDAGVDCHIDTVQQLFPHHIVTTKGVCIPFDVASINTGALRNGEPLVRPLPHVSLLRNEADIAATQAACATTHPIAVVGGGAAGIEVATALADRRHKEKNHAPVLLLSKETVPHLRRGTTSPRMAHAVLDHGRFVWHGGQEIHHLETTANDQIRLYSATTHESWVVGHIVWLTGPVAPPWMRMSTLPLCPKGYALVTPTLHVISMPHLFAVGDCRTHVHAPHIERAGVHAVREAAILAHNIQAQVPSPQKMKLRTFIPRKRSLFLVRLGYKKGLLLWGHHWGIHRSVWHLKRHIDQQHMNRFTPYRPNTTHL